MNRTVVALVAVFVAMVSVQTGASLAKTLFPLAGATGATTLRLVFAALVLAIAWRPWRRRIGRADARAIVAYGLALGAMNLSFYLSLRTLPLGIAVALEFTGPLTVAVLGSRRAIDFLWVALAAIGIVLILPIFEGSVPLDPVGIAWALAAGACWGLYIHFGKRAGDTIHGGLVTSLGMIVAMAFVLPFGVVGAGARLLDVSILPLAFGVAVLSSALPYSLEMIGLQRLPARTFGVLMSLEPALAALSGWLILGERLEAKQMVAVGCVMAASVGSTLGAARARTVPAPSTSIG